MARTITLTDEELRRAAMGCRVLEYRAQQDAEPNAGPIRDTFLKAAAGYRQLAEKFEAAISPPG